MSITQPIVSPTTETSAAIPALLEKLGRIPGVCVSFSASNPLGSPVIEVAVDGGNVDAEMAVYRAEMEVHQQFADARIELYVV